MNNFNELWCWFIFSIKLTYTGLRPAARDRGISTNFIFGVISFPSVICCTKPAPRNIRPS